MTKIVQPKDLPWGSAISLGTKAQLEREGFARIPASFLGSAGGDLGISRDQFLGQDPLPPGGDRLAMDCLVSQPVRSL